MNTSKILIVPVILFIVALGGCSGSGQDSQQPPFPTEQLFLGHVVRDLPVPGDAIVFERAVASPGFQQLPDFNGDGLSDLLGISPFAGIGSVRMGQGDGLFSDFISFPLDPSSLDHSNHFAIFDDFNGDGIQDFIIASEDEFLPSICLYFVATDGSVAPGGCVTGLDDLFVTISSGDVNEDGMADLMVYLYQAPVDYALFLSDGDGSFVRVDEPVVFRNPPTIIDDFDSDGHLDLIDSGGFIASFEVALGNGDGSFQAVQVFPIDEGIVPVFLKDLNGDEQIDIIAETDGGRPRMIQSLLNSGDNTFALVQTLPEAESAVDLIDFNADGILDIFSQADNDGISLVFLGNGDGTFSEVRSTRFAKALSVAAFDVGHFDQDGITDVRAGSAIYFGRGDGTFETHPILKTGITPRIAEPVDLDGNGALDLLTANEGSDDVSVLLNRGDATFEPEVRYPVGEAPRNPTLSDLDADGNVDLVTVNANTNDISVLLGNGDGTFSAEARFSVGLDPDVLFIENIAGDAALDILTVNRESGDISILAGDGSGRFAPEERLGFEKDLLQLILEDLDGDGLTDLVVYQGEGCESSCESSELLFFRRLESAGFDVSQILSTQSFSNFQLVDLNQDGVLDIVSRRWWDDELTILLGDGDGIFTTEIILETGDGPDAVLVVDLDNDGHLDLVTPNRESDDITIFFNRQEEDLFEAFTLPVPVGIFHSVKAEDMNGDQWLDLIVTGSTMNTGAIDSETSVTVFLNGGDGTFLPLEPVTGNGFTFKSLFIDVNGDGLADVVTSHLNADLSSPTFHSIFLNLGGVLAPEVEFAQGFFPVGDLDRDGDFDFVDIVRDGIVLNLNRLDQIQD